MYGYESLTTPWQAFVLVERRAIHLLNGIQWNLQERDTLGKWPMSLVERSSLSRRFVFFSLYHPNTSLFPIYNELFTVGVSNDNSQL